VYWHHRFLAWSCRFGISQVVGGYQLDDESQALDYPGKYGELLGVGSARLDDDLSSISCDKI
jgi:hypothetical protein